MNEKRGLILVFFTAIISGFSIFINKFGVSETNPYVFTWLKNASVAIFLVGVILLLKEAGRVKELSRKQWAKLMLIGLVGGSIPFLLFFKGLSMTSAAMASFTHKTMFVYATILAILFLKEKVNKSIIIGAITLLAGNLLLLRVGWKGFNPGDLLVLIATVLWALEVVISKETLKEVDGIIVAAGRMVFGSIFILGFLAATGQAKQAFALTMPQMLWVFVTSIFLLLYVFTFYNGLKLVNVSTATSILLLGSVITTVLSFVFLNTAVTITQGIGMLLIIAGVIMVTILQEFDVGKILWKA